ncbi:MAG: hypothetical protein ACI83E_001766 [Sulfitobacter sp.]
MKIGGLASKCSIARRVSTVIHQVIRFCIPLCTDIDANWRNPDVTALQQSLSGN